MKVVTHTLDEFLESLRQVRGVFENAIRVSITKNPEDNPNKYKAAKLSVNFQCSAICRPDEHSEYLLEFGEDTGFDYHDKNQELEGTERAGKMKEQIKSFAESRGWKVLPGTIHE